LFHWKSWELPVRVLPGAGLVMEAAEALTVWVSGAEVAAL